MYHGFPRLEPTAFADFDLRLCPARFWSIRRWIKAQVNVQIDGQTPFEPFPTDHAFPLFEWSLNWAFARKFQHKLAFHAGVVEKNGFGILLPAYPGSGKSTLTAALTCRGWRLLSDEFGLLDPESGLVSPFPRPIPLKNESIAVIERFAAVPLGPTFDKTRKGTVRHMPAPTESVNRIRDKATINLVLFPQYAKDEGTELTPIPKSRAHLRLATHAFNYEVLGEAAFSAIVSIVRRVPCYDLRYSDLNDVIRRIEAMAK